MRKILLIIILTCLKGLCMAQQEQVISPSNGTVTSLEKNVLFYADRRYQVSQSGSVQLPLQILFDGKMSPAYTEQKINPNNPYVLLIENLPNIHLQRGAWIGWSARYFQPKRYKIEAYDNSTNLWKTISDVQNNYNSYHIASIPAMAVGKIKFTIYESVNDVNILGLSEFFYIDPEMTQAYDNLLVKYNNNGYVGIGTNNPRESLSVNGNIRAHEIKVETTNWPDYVFNADYKLRSLDSLQSFIQANGHLPDVPKAADAEKEGISLGEMNKLLLKKIEELTLYLLDKEKQMKEFEKRLEQVEISNK